MTQIESRINKCARKARTISTALTSRAFTFSVK